MKAKKHLATVMAATMVVGSVVPVMAETTNETIIGKNRIETAIKISKDGWSSAETVILVNDGAIADALTATPLAFAKNAPILLTGKNGLNAQTKAEIKRLGAKNAILIGGNAVLPAGIEKELKELGLKPDRIKGATREETALEIAKRLDAISDVSEIAVVNGTKGLADAVSVAAAAAERHMPIILANPKKGLAASEKFIKAEDIKASYLIGGTAVLPNKMVSKLPGKKRIEGSNRNDTNAKVIETFYAGKELKNVYVAKDGRGGDSQLIDALAVGVLAAKNASPVLIASKNLNSKQVNVINTKEVSNIVQVGGKGNEGAFNHLKEIEKEDVYEVETVEELKEALAKANANDKIVLKPNATITEDIIIDTNKNVDIKVEGTVTGKVEITAPNGNVVNNSTTKPETNKPSGGGSSSGGTVTPSKDQDKIDTVTIARNAVNYEYTGESKYTYTGEVRVSGEENATIEIAGPYDSINLGYKKPEDGSGVDLKKAAMDDMARYLGALYRSDKNHTISAIKYNNNVYKWSDKLSNILGSRWTKDLDSTEAQGNTLVSNIVADFRNGTNKEGGTIELTLVGKNNKEVSVKLNFAKEYKVSEGGKALSDAVNKIADSDYKKGTVKLTNSVTGDGIGLFNNSNGKKHVGVDLTIDLGNNIYTVNENAIGSTGYENQGLHLEKDNKVTIKNGTIGVSENNRKVQFLIQNYCDLTLENLTLNGGAITWCVASFNNGNSKLSNVNISSLYKKGNVDKVGDLIGIDIMHWPLNGAGNSYYPIAPTVVINNNDSNKIDGKVDVYCDEKDHLESYGGKPTLTINGGKFTGVISDHGTGVIIDNAGVIK